MNTTANTDTATFAKGTSTTGAVHLLLAGSRTTAACATGKVQTKVAPVLEGTDPDLTCKRCIRLAANMAAQAATDAIDAAIAQAEAAGDVTPDEAQGLRETAPEAAAEVAAELVEGHVDDALAAAAPAAAPTQRRARVNQRELVMAYLEANPGVDFTPHQLSKALTPEGAKPYGLRDVCARLADAGEIELVEGTKSATYRLPELPENATA